VEAGDVIQYIDYWIIVEVLKDNYRCLSFDVRGSALQGGTKLHIRYRIIDPGAKEAQGKWPAFYRHDAINNIFTADKVTTAW
jgi:hypothetical protein